MNPFVQFVFPKGLFAYSLIFMIFAAMPKAQAQGCSQPSNLTSVGLSTTSVQLSWSAIQEASSYRLQYRVGNSGTWTTVNGIASTSYTLTGLLENTVYTWRVRASCSVYSSIVSFNTGSTGGGSTSCSAPSNTNTDYVLPTSPGINWEPQADAINYTVQYRLASSTTFTTLGVFTTPTAVIPNLMPGQEYVARKGQLFAMG